MFKIALDAHGGDYGLKPNIMASIEISKSENDIELILVGREDEIKREFVKHGYNNLPPNTKIFHASQVIEMEKEPVDECKNKPNSSIMVGCEIVSQKIANAFVSAGNSGAVMVASLLKIGRIKGILRPAIAIPFPTKNGKSLILDVGANTDVKAINLVQFAMMGTVFLEKIWNKENPKVGILSIGEEETKGNSLVLETISFLKNIKNVNFIGPVEGRDIPFGKADIIICDGFVGNIVLKLSEGIVKFIKEIFKDEISKSPIRKLGGFLMKGVFKKFKQITDHELLGGALLLGVDGVVLICHGNSSHIAILNAIKTAKEMLKNNVVSKIKQDIEEKMLLLEGVSYKNH